MFVEWRCPKSKLCHLVDNQVGDTEPSQETTIRSAESTEVSPMAAECLALRDLTSPRKSFAVVTEEEGDRAEQKENICMERRRCSPLKVPRVHRPSPADPQKRGR
ncbi:unnamed protein product [Pleuronectes platessa]|uniref:Uncharacterized protein n=1 Tax=Pleuronectes platessa TaxID=8262 RepID=A0A9N7UQK3_PLEPL|nr:unnamed protein product [Pleuronectes platessa]